jgi:hypothetical protein
MKQRVKSFMVESVVMVLWDMGYLAGILSEVFRIFLIVVGRQALFIMLLLLTVILLVLAMSNA